MLFTPIVLILLCFIPLLVNYNLAKKRGQNILLIMFLTVIFSWLITLILVFAPEDPTSSEDNIKK